MYRDNTVAMVVPAYNESGYVGEVIDDVPAYVDRVYVVDDGSTDDTWSEIRHHTRRQNDDHSGEFDRLVVPIQHEENRGVGGAIKTGYLRAREEGIDVTAVLAGDGQMNPATLERYLDPIVDDRAGYTKGNRFSRPADWEAMPRFRLVGNVILSYLTKVASGYWETMDSQNGYTAISLAALERVEIEEMYEYYGYCNDLLIRLNEADVRVADVPRSAEFAYSDGWKSHIEYTEYVPRVSAMLFDGFLRRLRRKYLLTDYHPLIGLYLLGIVGTVAGLVGIVWATLKRDGEGIAHWSRSTMLGTVVLLGATEFDRRENHPLQIAVGRGEDPATDDRRAGHSAGANPPATTTGAGGNGGDDQAKLEAEGDAAGESEGGVVDDDTGEPDRSRVVEQ